MGEFQDTTVRGFDMIPVPILPEASEPEASHIFTWAEQQPDGGFGVQGWKWERQGGKRRMKMRGGRRKKKNQTDQTLGRRKHRPLPYVSVVSQSALCGFGAVREAEGVQDGKRTFS